MRVIIMSGIPGAGKGRWIEEFIDGHTREDFRTFFTVSADSFFETVDGYRFDPSLLPMAHGTCLRRFVSYCQESVPTQTIIVDNTNTTIAEIAPYYALAQAYGHSVTLVTIEADPIVAHARNVHGVPLASCERGAANLAARVIPPFWDLTQIRG